MKKGEMMRSAILDTSERLFFAQGYDNTSVQDVLDALKLSKGGFYHHFPSKEAILEEITLRHVERAVDQVRHQLSDERLQPLDKVDRILAALNLLSWGDREFAALAIKICWMNRDVQIASHLRRALMQALLPLMDEAVAEGIRTGDLFSRYPARVGAMALRLAWDTDDESFALLTEQLDNPERLLDVLNALDAGREAVELLLGAPYGTIQLFDPAALRVAYQDVRQELKRLEESK